MASFVKVLYDSISSDKDIMPKAIANFLFRELIEDAHAKKLIMLERLKKILREMTQLHFILMLIM